jgi:F0F1-type ATP synthase delta subunit
LLEDLEDYLETAPHISITLAAPASKKLKQALMDWCRTNINADILVDFSFNSSLLGGLVVRYGSHIYDWSFKRQLMANLSKFPEVLRRV